MSDGEIDLPDDWSRRSLADQREAAIVEFDCQISAKTGFIVSILHREGTADYQLVLSTFESASTHSRHDYPVETYESRDAAITGSKSFIRHLSHQVGTEEISPLDPDIVNIQRAIHKFSDGQHSGILRRLVRHLR